MRIGLRLGRMIAKAALCGSVAMAASCTTPPSSSALRERPTAAPRGYIAFCTEKPQFCDGRGPRKVKLTGARWAELLRVNDRVNGRLRPAADRPAAADDWAIPTGAATADCTDYVLAKKAELLKLGWPGPALRIAVVEIPGTPAPARRHAVLLADTDDGVFVLDNLSQKVTRPVESDYSWIKIQVSTLPDRWEQVTTVSFNDARP
jgi:predicted transglutaminase-like cysteine proteinase